ncbi:tetratricopeptide repeat protein [Microtetraspora niveoalba]|uniref:tetratricopeptide repeat protein n=1 Tax=Microtetraspora niveoalba TaxID=46175 RepID=UPI00083038DF|nr:tetratricopeptide repeat protein [Microtetraspora niveoalba]
MSADDRIEQARLLYERAVFGGDTGAVAAAERELDAVEADLVLARGRIAHARFLDSGHEDPHELSLFERAAELRRRLGDVRGEAEALFWIGCFHQVVRNDDAAAVPVLEQSHGKAVHAGDVLTASYALRHLGIADQRAGRPESARERLEESTRLRREVGFLPGVAANLVGLAYVTAGEGRRDEALKLLDEAGSIAETAGAHGILRHVQEARARL